MSSVRSASRCPNSSRPARSTKSRRCATATSRSPIRSAIIHYLEAKYPDGGLIPADPRDRGRAIWYEEYADTVMMTCGAKIFFNRFVAPKVLGRPGDEADCRGRRARRIAGDPRLSSKASCLASDGFLVGDSLTIADLAIVGPFRNFAIVGIDVDRERYPKLAAFTARMLARPSFEQIFAKEDALLKRLAERAA